jgi:signal transduction histidine kinase
MLEKQRQQWYDEAQLQDYIAALEQENALLWAELDICQLEKGTQERVAELAKVNDELRQRDRLLSVVAQVTKDLLEAEDVDAAIPAALQAVGEAANMSRVQLILEHQELSTQKRQHIMGNEWVAAGITAQIGNPDLAIIDNDEIEVLLGELYAGRSVWRIVDDLPEILRVKFSSIGIKSTGTVPIVIEGRYIGCVAFDDCVVPRHWTQQEIDVLTAAADSIGAALYRKQLVERLIQERARTAEERAAELAKINAVLAAEVIERSRAERLARGQTEALVKILTALAAEPVLDNFLGCVLQSIADQLGDPCGGIWLYDETYNTTILHINYENGEIQRGVQIARPGSIHNVIGRWDVEYVQLLREQRILIQDVQQLPDIPEYAPYRAYNQQHGIKTILVIPLFFGETFLGNITLRSTKQRNYQPEELELARVLAYQATLAIQLTHLSEQSRHSAVLEERNRLAREIHDTIAQGLTGIVIQLQAAQDVDTTDPNDRQAHITQARHLAEASLAEARRSVRALRPLVLEGTNLAGALTSLNTQLTLSTSLHSTFGTSGTPYPLPPDVEINLLRIAQEAVNNTLKHAKASEIQIELIYQPHRVQLRVQDNGQGFDPTLPTGGYGLLGMQERAHHIGATLTLSSQPGIGTDVQVQVPTG